MYFCTKNRIGLLKRLGIYITLGFFTLETRTNVRNRGGNIMKEQLVKAMQYHQLVELMNFLVGE